MAWLHWLKSWNLTPRSYASKTPSMATTLQVEVCFCLNPGGGANPYCGSKLGVSKVWLGIACFGAVMHGMGQSAFIYDAFCTTFPWLGCLTSQRPRLEDPGLLSQFHVLEWISPSQRCSWWWAWFILFLFSVVQSTYLPPIIMVPNHPTFNGFLSSQHPHEKSSDTTPILLVGVKTQRLDLQCP